MTEEKAREQTVDERCPACFSTVKEIRFELKLHSSGFSERWMKCFHPWHESAYARGRREGRREGMEEGIGFDEHEQIGRELINRWEIIPSKDYPGMFELNGIDGKLHRYYLATTPCGRICLRDRHVGLRGKTADRDDGERL